MTLDRTVPGLSIDAGRDAAAILQQRLNGLIDLALTLKHIHWNVVGPNFIAVHEMLDPQVDAVRAMADAAAERIATLGGEPHGTPGFIVANRTWDDYPLSRDTVESHLRVLDDVYTGMIEDHRRAQKRLADIDPISEDLIVGQTRDLELFQWFVRAHLQRADGTIPPRG